MLCDCPVLAPGWLGCGLESSSLGLLLCSGEGTGHTQIRTVTRGDVFWLVYPLDIPARTPTRARSHLHLLRLGYKALSEINPEIPPTACSYCPETPPNPLLHYFLSVHYVRIGAAETAARSPTPPSFCNGGCSQLDMSHPRQNHPEACPRKPSASVRQREAAGHYCRVLPQPIQLTC